MRPATIKKKKEKEKFRNGTAVFTTIPNNNKDGFKIPNKIVINSKDIENSPKISVLNVSSEGLFNKEDKLLFNANGLIDKGRANKDGVVYYTSRANKEQLDYVLNTNYLPSHTEKDNNYIFATYYVKESNSYNINFYHKTIPTQSEKPLMFYESYLMFIQVDHIIPVKLLLKEVIKIGDIIFEFIPITGGLLTVVNVTDNNSKLIFHPQDKQITIGRSEECVIRFESEKNISKVQVTIDYVVKCGCWFLKDGNEEKASTNGTMLYAINEYPLYDGLIACIDNKPIQFQFEA